MYCCALLLYVLRVMCALLLYVLRVMCALLLCVLHVLLCTATVCDTCTATRALMSYCVLRSVHILCE